MITNYQNPIIRGMHPDPSIVRVDDTYYLVNSTFEYYPGMTVLRSKDLLNWKTLGGVAIVPEQADLRNSKSNEGIFAVNIHYHDGYFYVITTNFAEFKTFIIRGRLSNDGESIDWEKKRIEVDVPGIDPDIYFEDGRTYVQFTGYIDDKGTKAIRQVEVNLETGEILDGPKILTYGTGGRDVEGPHIFKKDGYYYLLMAEGGTGQGHMITIMRSKNLWGSYEATDGINPIFTNRDHAEQGEQNVGHADLFTDSEGNWWMVCLGTRPATTGFKQITNLGRETLLYPVIWKNGWPEVNRGIPTEEVDLTNFPEHAKVLKESQKLINFTDNFSENKLRPEWLTLRDSLKDNLFIEDKKLHLIGNDKTVSDLSTPAFIGLRQTEHNEKFVVKIDVNLSKFNDGEFGIVSLIDADNHAAIMIKKSNDKYEVYRNQQIFDIEINKKISELPTAPIVFELINTVGSKEFIVKDIKGNIIGYTTDAIHLSNEAIAALNTGDFQGLYAKGNAQMVVDSVNRISK